MKGETPVPGPIIIIGELRFGGGRKDPPDLNTTGIDGIGLRAFQFSWGDAILRVGKIGAFISP